jgi:hypothetical protein
VKFRIVVTVMAAATLVAACGAPTPGQAKPAAGATAAGPSFTGSAPSGSSSASGGSLKDVDPCTLLTKDEAQQLGAVGEPKPERIGSAQTCGWKPEGVSFHVAIRANAGLSGAQPNGGEIRDTTVGHHQAKQLVDVSGSCGIFIGVTSTSRVDVSLNSGPRVDPCPLALQVAQLVEPKLP